MKKKSLTILSVLILILSFALAGCSVETDSNIKYKDVYKNHTSLTKYDGYEQIGEKPLPVGCEVAFNEAFDPFFETHNWVVVKNAGKYGVYDYKNNSFVLGGGTTGNPYKINFTKNESFFIYQSNTSEKVTVEVLSTRATFTVNTTNFSNVKVPSGESDLLFVDIYSSSGNFYEIYNKNGYLHKVPKQIEHNGRTYSIDKFAIYDNTIMATSSNSAVMFIDVPKEPAKKPTDMLVVDDDSVFSASSEICPSYIGDNKFYVFEQNNSYSEDYDYSINLANSVAKYKGRAFIFNAKTHTVEKEINDNKYYKHITTNKSKKFFSKEENVMSELHISLNDILNEGYNFVDSGFYIDTIKKEAVVDQFIIDKNNEVVISLSGKIAGSLSVNKDKVNGFSPLMLLFVDGKGVSPNSNLSSIRLMNIDGSTAFEKQGLYKDLYYNNNALVCQKSNATSTVGAMSNDRYGAFDKFGNQIVDFKYDYMTPFISEYALAYDLYIEYDKELIRYNEIYLKDGLYYKGDGTPLRKDFKPLNAKKDYKVYRVDKFGNAIEIEDIAKTPANTRLIFKVGAYVCKNDDGTFNVKNIEGEKLFNEDFTTVVIDKPNFEDVVIYGTKNNQVHMYKLTSSLRGIEEAEPITNIIIPVAIAGGILLLAVILAVVGRITTVNARAKEVAMRNANKQSQNKNTNKKNK